MHTFLPSEDFNVCKGFGPWQTLIDGSLKLAVVGNIVRKDLASLSKAIAANGHVVSHAVLREWVASLSRNFSVIGRYGNISFGAVDRISSSPLFIGSVGNTTEISNNAPYLEQKMQLKHANALDGKALISFLMAGYTIGQSTLNQHIKRLRAGEYVLVENGSYTVGRYHRYEPWKFENRSLEHNERLLSDTTLHIVEDMVARSSGRQIAVPISGGVDSRLIASALRHIGAKNVVCFSYGRANNFEGHVGKKVAECLNFPWHFVEITPKRQTEFFHSDSHVDYMRFADNLSSVPFKQDIVPITNLLKKGVLASDCLIVNGNTGDFISGGHIPKSFIEERPDGTSAKGQLIDNIIKKHLSLWPDRLTPEVKQQLREIVSDELHSEGLLDICDDSLFAAFEFSEFTNRQSKYVINGQRIYDYLGVDWELPLWHDRYLEFWQSVPLEHKIDQSLYKEMLHRRNWGGVWHDIPVNKKTITPSWIRPLRGGAKLAFAPFGRASWHRFEKRFLNYWTDVLANYAIYPYKHIAFSRANARNSVAWHVVSYLDWKGIDYEIY